MAPNDSRPAPVEAERAWKRAIEEHAAATMRVAIDHASHTVATIALGTDCGGLVVDIDGPDGEVRSFYVRLTEVVK